MKAINLLIPARLARVGVLALLLLGGCALPEAEAPGAVVAAVYARGVRGLPSGRVWEDLEARFSTDFAAAIGHAQSVQAREIAEHPDEKPSWIEGDFFSSLFEGPESYVLGPAILRGGRAEVPVWCSHSAGGVTTRWSDKFLLVREGGTWRIDDVVRGGTWDFASKGSLKASLR